MGLNFKIVYRKGKENAAADALSRVAHLLFIQAVSVVQPAWVQEVLNSYTIDSKAQQLLQQLTIHSPDEQGYSLDKGLIWFNGKVWIGHNSALQTKIIAFCHSSAIRGHSGIATTYQRLKRYFAWKAMKQDVENYVRQCTICQQSKHLNTHPFGLLQPLPIPQGIWRDLSMDFIEGLPKSKGFSVILVIVDRLTKYAHFLPVKHPYSTQTIAQLFLDNIIKLHGLPNSIVTDRDTIFVSNFWKELFKIYRVDLHLTTAYHPQSDGQTERVNQCVEMYLRCSVQDAPTTWKDWLPLAEIWYNSSFHTAIGCSPFKALYGYEANLGAVPTIPENTPSDVKEIVANRELHLEALK
jgi:transposase InsO family protein